jgi:hypothetical protein
MKTGHYNGSKMDFPKITHVKSNSPNAVQEIDKKYNPTSAAKDIN